MGQQWFQLVWKPVKSYEVTAQQRQSAEQDTLVIGTERAIRMLGKVVKFRVILLWMIGSEIRKLERAFFMRTAKKIACAVTVSERQHYNTPYIFINNETFETKSIHWLGFGRLLDHAGCSKQRDMERKPPIIQLYL